MYRLRHPVQHLMPLPPHHFSITCSCLLTRWSSIFHGSEVLCYSLTSSSLYIFSNLMPSTLLLTEHFLPPFCVEVSWLYYPADLRFTMVLLLLSQHTPLSSICSYHPVRNWHLYVPFTSHCVHTNHTPIEQGRYPPTNFYLLSYSTNFKKRLHTRVIAFTSFSLRMLTRLQH